MEDRWPEPIYLVPQRDLGASCFDIIAKLYPQPKVSLLLQAYSLSIILQTEQVLFFFLPSEVTCQLPISKEYGMPCLQRIRHLQEKNGLTILHWAYFPLHFADGIVFAMQLINKRKDARGTANKIPENLLSLRGDSTASWAFFPFAIFSCIPCSGLMPYIRKLLDSQRGSVRLPAPIAMARGDSGPGKCSCH